MLVWKPTNSANPRGQPNPKKNQVSKKVAFLGHFFFPGKEIIFRGLGLILYRITDYEKPNPTKILRKNTLVQISFTRN